VIGELVKLKAAGELVGSVSSSEGTSETRSEQHAADGHEHHHDEHHSHPNGEASSRDAQSTAPSGQPAPAEAEGLPEEAIDPVCGMTVSVAGARYTSEFEGKTYYFCCPACRKTFESSPQDYVTAYAPSGSSGA
jgi:YHS domain-containing protein